MQHRAYQPLLPSANRYLQQKWDKASYDLHRRKVNSAKPTINTGPPNTKGHLALKLKKQKFKDWTVKIEKENEVLKEKLSHIQRTTGRIDNRNYYDRKSLGKERRQLELQRITKENQMILLHLNQCKPYYNVRSWHEDWLKTLNVMDRIAHYPRRANQPKKEQEKPGKISRDCDTEQEIHNEATTLSSVNNTPSGKADSEENEKKPETSQKRDAGREIHKETDTQHASEPDVPEKSISPDTPVNPGFSDISQ